MTFSTLITSIAIFVVVLAVVAVVLLKMKAKKEDNADDEIIKNHQKTTNKESLIEANNENLLQINIALRENVFSKSIIKEFEDIIDLVKEVFVIANDPNKYSEQTVIVNRMSSDYLPKVLNGYLLVQNQENSEKNTLELLEKIKTQLIVVKNSYENINQEEFERNTRIMKSIFESFNAQAKGE